VGRPNKVHNPGGCHCEGTSQWHDHPSSGQSGTCKARSTACVHCWAEWSRGVDRSPSPSTRAGQPTTQGCSRVVGHTHVRWRLRSACVCGAVSVDSTGGTSPPLCRQPDRYNRKIRSQHAGAGLARGMDGMQCLCPRDRQTLRICPSPKSLGGEAGVTQQRSSPSR